MLPQPLKIGLEGWRRMSKEFLDTKVFPEKILGQQWLLSNILFGRGTLIIFAKGNRCAFTADRCEQEFFG